MPKNNPLPDNEAVRLAALEAYHILDTAPERAFDRIAIAAANLCNTPIALVSLIDSDRQWFKSCIGLDVGSTARECAFCAHAIMNPETFMEITDATMDERFHDNPLVTGDPYIRFYAGQPLTSRDGYGLGTLCVIDRQPRTLTNEQRTGLVDLAKIVEGILEDRLDGLLRA